MKRTVTRAATGIAAVLPMNPVTTGFSQTVRYPIAGRRRRRPTLSPDHPIAIAAGEFKELLAFTGGRIPVTPNGTRIASLSHRKAHEMKPGRPAQHTPLCSSPVLLSEPEVATNAEHAQAALVHSVPTVQPVSAPKNPDESGKNRAFPDIPGHGSSTTTVVAIRASSPAGRPSNSLSDESYFGRPIPLKREEKGRKGKKKEQKGTSASRIRSRAAIGSAIAVSNDQISGMDWLHHTRRLVCALSIATLSFGATAQEGSVMGSVLLTNGGDLSAQMVEGIDRWLTRETQRVVTERTARQTKALTAAHRAAAQSRLREIIGALDPLATKPNIEVIGPPQEMPLMRDGFTVLNIRWPAMENVWAEGLLLVPTNASAAARQPTVICLPDADQSPEALAGIVPGVAGESQFARHLAESGWRVIIPVLVSRSDSASGNERLKRFTNQPHREWIYRQSYELGRHVIGYEVQKVIAAINALGSSNTVAVAGFGEGGLIALYAAALDPRIRAALVSGYFGPRENLWSEPIYRNVSGVLRDFGDAEIAALGTAALVIEHSAPPRVSGPPAARPGRSGAAPGSITAPELGEVESEVDRAKQLGAKIELVHGSEGARVSFGSRKSLALLARAMGVKDSITTTETVSSGETDVLQSAISNREHRTVRDLEQFTQTLFRRSADVRNARFGNLLQDSAQFTNAIAGHRQFFWTNVIGKIDQARLPLNPRTRQIHDKEKWKAHEVMLDVFPEVFAWGYLLVPKDLKPGERRPVVVCQHGLEGVPEDTVDEDPKSSGFHAYQAFAAKLAERGFIVYAPHNPYRGRDKFRVLQRKANPLSLSLFSFIIAQHEATTEWLAGLPFVDPNRIAFYGLSYGGKTAMRVPAVIDRYCLSICSADFNEWIQKNVTTDSPYSYMFTMEYEMPEWNLGHTFNYAEMAALIAPRPFMVERGHDDGVAPDEWVAYEYAKVRRTYTKLGIGDRTEIEFFDGPHQIHGVGTFKFLHKHLNWPQP